MLKPGHPWTVVATSSLPLVLSACPWCYQTEAVPQFPERAWLEGTELSLGIRHVCLVSPFVLEWPESAIISS